MAAISQRHNNPHASNTYQQQGGVITEEIQGLIRVHRDGHVERPPVVPHVSSHHTKLPLLVYFHGGGFCVGSASWKCYHDFLTNLASKANCVILSVNYHLAPESRLPAAYDDGFNTLMWVKQEALNPSSPQKWWIAHTNLSSLFLAGDSAGGNIAYNVALSRILSNTSCAPTILNPLSLKGIILIQPFFGGEARTSSEKQYSNNNTPNSALTISASDTYWRLALPIGANRDHHYCNPLAYGSARMRDLRLPPTLVCVSELDILRDRNLEFSNALAKAGKKVETLMYKGVGHAFQVLHNSHLSHSRAQDMVNHIRNFLI